jgi:hypothetical protein
MKFAYGIPSIGVGHFLPITLAHIPSDSRVLLVNDKPLSWSLARKWNYIMDVILWDEAYDAVIIMNDDVVLRPDTGKLLAWGMLEGQFLPSVMRMNADDISYEDRWGASRPELLLLSARHASWSDACTDEPDWEMLKNARPRWEPGPDFSCFCVSRRFCQEIGRFDEEFYPAYFEDNDTHRRIKLAGFEAGAFAPYWHFRNGMTRKDPNLRTLINSNFESCKKRYCEKWGAPYDNGNPMGRETFLTPFNQ